MRLFVFSLIDDWPLGELLVARGHEILGWVRPSWEKPSPLRHPAVQSLRAVAKHALSRARPLAPVPARYDASAWVRRRGIAAIACPDANDRSFVEFIAAQRPDLLVVGMYPKIFKAPLLGAARLGVINYHPSPLPRYAGPQPIFWMLRDAEPEAAITVHVMTAEVDGGDILAQERLPIGDDENA